MSAEATSHYLEEFAAFEGAEAATDGDGLRALRRDAIERFGALGFPTRKLEDWRYTSIAPIDPSEMYRVRPTSRPQVPTAAREDHGASAVTTPSAVATPLPPLKPSHGVNT